MREVVIVFVHLNTVFPKHLIANIKRTNELYPEKIVCVVTNVAQELPLDLSAVLIRMDVSKYEGDLQNHQFDRGFRDGFWQTSLIRIFVLEMVHDLYNGKALLHVESDVLLFTGFPFETLSQIDKIMWSRFGDATDVGALIFSPEISQTHFLVSEMRRLIREDPQLTDMSALSRMRETHPGRIKLFPGSVSDPDFKSLPYIFDGAMLGMWLLGQDSRNNYGYTPRYKSLVESHYQFRKGDVQIDADGNVVCHSGSQKTRLVSLHVHCKDVRLFKSDNYLILKRVKESNRFFRFPLFSIRVFSRLFFEAITKGNIKAYIYHFPALGRILRAIRVIISRCRLGFRDWRGE